MKQIKKLLQRIRQTFSPTQGKQGSSLAFVMMVGAALVIWVLCIMPLMATTGETAIKTQVSYDEYLQSRSSIEFVKSELEKIVETKLPYTFAVTYDDSKDVNGDLIGFTAVPKRIGNTPNPSYSALVFSPFAQEGYLPTDKDDTPLDSEAGDSVTAICAVTPGIENPNVYDITITTFHKGEKGLVYKAVFTPRGSLLINPEAYKQEQALPLSDFVLVDGKMGPYQVWDSTITWSPSNTKDAENLNFMEILKPWVEEPEPFYADSSEFPAVFKTTAHAAYEGHDIAEPVDMGPMTSDETWIMPQSGTSGTPGNIWFETNNGNIKVYLYTTEKVDITEDCTVYLNGTEVRNKKVPTNPGYFQVAVDYPGTDYSNEDNPNKYDGTKVNVLPIDGLFIKNTQSKNLNTLPNGNADDHTVPDGCEIESIDEITHEHKNDKGEVIEVTYTYTVTLKQPVVNGKPAEDLLYGYASSKDNTDTVHWSSSNVIEGLEKEDGIAYYFYIAHPSTYENGIVTNASEVKEVGMIFAPKFVTGLVDNGKYAMFGTKDGKLYALNSGLSVDQVDLDEGFIVSGMDLSGYTWTAGKSDNKYSFKNNSGKYLNVNTSAEINISEESINHLYHNCIKRTCSCSWTYGVSVGDKENFNISNPTSREFILYVEDSKTSDNFKEYDCSWFPTNKTFNTTAYLNLNGSVSAAEYSSNQPTVKFMQMPDAAPQNVALPGANYTIADSLPFGTDVLEHVQNAVGSAEVVALYANGQRVTGALNAGEYYMVAKLKVDDVICFVSFGSLRIEKGNLEGDHSINYDMTDTDEFRVNVSAQGWHSNGGVRYFGYMKQADNGTYPEEYNWVTTTGDSFAFRLKYGTYKFAVKESGTRNYNSLETECDGEVTIARKSLTAEQIKRTDFEYTFPKTVGSTDEDVVWYSLPDGVYDERVTLVFKYTHDRYYLDDEVIYLTTYQGTSYNYYYNSYYYKSFQFDGYYVIIEDSPYDCEVYNGQVYPSNGKTVFEINEPIGVDFTNGHQSSMMQGSSLYFMGGNGSIDTHGTKIYLKADLLVLNSDIKGGGEVYVESYTKGGLSNNTVLLFIAKRSGIERDGTKIFEGHTFYRIPAGADIDLSDVNAITAAEWKIGGVDNSTVKYYFRIGMYPEIDLDIAYADAAQLARILSSETMGWTENGVLSGSNTDSCAAYVVPTYVTSINGDVKHKANRVLIAARANNSTILDTTDDSNTLLVPGNLEFVTRYLSVDADQIVQGNSGASFTIKNLGQDQNFIQWISGALGIQGYMSKSLQMDYERPTSIIYSNGDINPISSQICRYSDGADIFDSEIAPIELMARYNTGEIKSLFTNPLGSTVKIVDRYISMECDDGTGVLSVETGFQTKLDIYANYIYIDGSVDKLRVVDKIGNLLVSDITINSQEAGYTEEEYLGLFKYHSAETYTGTLMYFKESVQIETANTSFTVAPGFYYVYAKDNSSSITDLKNLYTGDDPNGNTEKKPVKVELDSLREYSVWVNPDGTLNDAYVDTGIEDNSSVNLGGFSGGKVE